jgi:hypothetical protein
MAAGRPANQLCPYHRSMSPHPRRRSVARPTVAIVAAVLALMLMLAGCSAPFDPSGPCTADGSAPGAYPELEAAVPAIFRDAKASDLDSGRACTPNGLATLAARGVKELRFAGGTWTTGTDSGLSLAVFVTADGPPLTRDWITEFYESGARTGKNVTSVETTDFPISATITARRIDVLNGESYQSLVIWEHAGKIAVALVADFIREIQTKEAHDVVVQQAVRAFGDSEDLLGG